MFKEFKWFKVFFAKAGFSPAKFINEIVLDVFFSFSSSTECCIYALIEKSWRKTSKFFVALLLMMMMIMHVDSVFVDRRRCDVEKKPETYTRSFDQDQVRVSSSTHFYYTTILSLSPKLIIEYFHHVVEYSLFNINSGPTKNARPFVRWFLVFFGCLLCASSLHNKREWGNSKNTLNFIIFSFSLTESSSSSSSSCYTSSLCLQLNRVELFFVISLCNITFKRVDHENAKTRSSSSFFFCQYFFFLNFVLQSATAQHERCSEAIWNAFQQKLMISFGHSLATYNDKLNLIE